MPNLSAPKPVLFRRLALGLLASALGWAVFFSGGVVPAQWNISLVLIACSGFIFCLFAPPGDRIDPWLRGCLMLFPSYVVFQLIPLPAGLLRYLSPERYELLRALQPMFPDAKLAPLAVMPSATFAHLLRVCGYVVVFLVVREITWRSSHRTWVAVFPLIVIAGLEAALGIAQHNEGSLLGFSRGTYVNRNHFAGLLEMILPFPVALSIVPFSRTASAWDLHWTKTLKATAALAVAALIMLGIVESWSRMGYVSAVCALLLVGFGGLRRRFKIRTRTFALVLGVGCLLSLALLPSGLSNRIADFVEAPGAASADRMAVWRETLEIVVAYPIFGCGLGGHEFTYLKYKNSMHLWTTDFTTNDYLQLLSELGVAGFLIAVAFIVRILVLATRAYLTTSEETRRLQTIACIAAIAAILTHSVLEFNLYIPANAMLLAWISGITAGLAAAAEVSGSLHGEREPEAVMEREGR